MIYAINLIIYALVCLILCYEWLPPKCEACMVFGHVHGECNKNSSADMKWSYRPKFVQRRTWVRKLPAQREEKTGNEMCDHPNKSTLFKVTAGVDKGKARAEEVGATNIPSTSKSNDLQGEKSNQWIHVKGGKKGDIVSKDPQIDKDTGAGSRFGPLFEILEDKDCYGGGVDLDSFLPND